MSISAKNLSYQIAGKEILKNIELETQPATITALVGTSGCGKTTLLNCLAGLIRPSSGSIVIDGVETKNWKDKDFRRFWKEKAAFVYQDHGILEEESVAYNISFTHPHWLRRKNKITPAILAALETVGLENRALELASHLSGGEQQRLGIARALYRQAKYLFIDEPTASLDRENRKLVLKLLRLAANSDATIIMATHDEEAIAFSDQIVTLPSN